MRIEDHVPTIETCQRMKELGWEKETLLWWRNDYPDHPGKYVDRWYIEKDYPYTYKPQRAIKYHELWHLLPAPLATEIMEELPYGTNLFRYKNVGDERGYESSCFDGVSKDVFTHAPNPAEALALMWIYLKENDLLPTQPDDHE